MELSILFEADKLAAARSQFTSCVDDVWTSGLWTRRRLNCGPGDVWTVVQEMYGLWTRRRPDCRPEDVRTAVQEMSGLWTRRCLDCGPGDVWTANHTTRSLLCCNKR